MDHLSELWEHLPTRIEIAWFIFLGKKLLNNSWLQGFASCPRAITPVLIASWVSVHSWHGAFSQRCLAITVEQKCFLLVIEITPYHYLSASYKAAVRFQIPVVKDNPLLTCPAFLVCSETANAIPAVLGGSFFLCSWQETRKWKVVWSWENCRNLAGDDFHLGNLSVPEGHLKRVLRIRGIRFSFQLVCLVIIIAIWDRIHNLALHLCRLNSYSWTSVLVNIDDKSQNAL